MRLIKALRQALDGYRLVLVLPQKALDALLALKTRKDQSVFDVVKTALLTHEVVMEAIRNGGTIHTHRGGGNFIPLNLDHIDTPAKSRSPFSVIKGGKDD